LTALTLLGCPLSPFRVIQFPAPNQGPEGLLGFRARLLPTPQPIPAFRAFLPRRSRPELAPQSRNQSLLHYAPRPAAKRRERLAVPPPAPSPAVRRSSAGPLSASGGPSARHGPQVMWLVSFELNFCLLSQRSRPPMINNTIKCLILERPCPANLKKKKRLANQWPHTVPTAAASGRPVSRGPGMRSLLASKAT